MTLETSTQPEFAVHFERTFLALRGSLTELILAAGGDPGRPQEMARGFGLDKTLAWKISKLMTGREPIPSVRHLPGSNGLEIVLTRLQQAGAPAQRLAAVRAARDSFEHMVGVQAGDRATLEVMLGSMTREPAHSPRLESARKKSFQGNSSTWGVQARLRWGTQLVTPNADDPDRVDLAVLSGYVDFRRLRRTAWPLVHVRSYGEADASSDQPLDPTIRSGPALLPEFCSHPLPDVRVLPEDGGAVYELAEGPIGNPRAVTCALGWINRSFASAVVPEDEVEEQPVAEHSLVLDTPVEEVQFDVFFHRSLPFEELPRAALFSLMEGRPAFPLSQQDRYLLELPLQVQRLGSRPPVVTTPELPRYAKMLELACDRLGSSLSEFAGYRLRLRYPPIPTMPFLYHRLPRRG